MKFGSQIGYKTRDLNSCLRLFILVHSTHCKLVHVPCLWRCYGNSPLLVFKHNRTASQTIICFHAGLVFVTEREEALSWAIQIQLTISHPVTLRYFVMW